MLHTSVNLHFKYGSCICKATLHVAIQGDDDMPLLVHFFLYKASYFVHDSIELLEVMMKLIYIRALDFQLLAGSI